MCASVTGLTLVLQDGKKKDSALVTRCKLMWDTLGAWCLL